MALVRLRCPMGFPRVAVACIFLEIALLAPGLAKGGVKELSPGDLGEGRQAVVDLWTHSEGPPKGQKVSLELPEGDSEAVARIVAAKKIEVAAAGLHHASVLEKQALEKKKASDEEDETEITRAKIADTKVHRFRTQVKSLDEKLSKLKDKQGDMLIKEEEAKAAVQMASKKKRKVLEGALKLAVAKRKSLALKIQDTDNKIKATAMEVVGAKEESTTAHAAQQETGLKNVADRVNLEAAKEKVLHAKFMALKSVNMKKLAVAKFSKENLKKQHTQAKNDVRSAKEMLAIMNSGPGTKEAKKSLDKAKKRKEDTKKKWVEATKNVDKVKNKILDNETKWAKKMAYKAVMKTAKLGAAANAADKAFQNALTDADKNSKKLAKAQIKKELAEAKKRAQQETTNAQNVAFAAKQDKKARKEAFDEEKKQMDNAKKEKENRKAESDMAKSALSATGKPPAQ